MIVSYLFQSKNISLIECLVVDVTLIRAFVDLSFDGMSPQERKPKPKVCQHQKIFLCKLFDQCCRAGQESPPTEKMNQCGG